MVAEQTRHFEEKWNWVNMERVDVIVPIFKGQCYINEIVSQLEECAERSDSLVEIGLILVNDDPADNFRENYSSEKIDVLMIETDQNRGIHGARVRGLLHCKGDYVVFLDQDDKIFPSYFKSQLEKLGDADAIICRAINGERKFYDNDRRFETLTSCQYLFSVGNGILSPGQVLIRRGAVSQFWKENILQNNGADDWMLWLCMMYEGMHFVKNQDVLYEHVLSGGNCSESTFKMHQSEKNMYKILEQNKYFDREHLERLLGAIDHGIDNRLKELDKLKKAVDIYDMWLMAQMENRSIGACLKSAGYQKVAIYGLSKMGLRLYQEIKPYVDVEYFIDRNAAFLKADIPVYSLEEAVQQVDLVIISLIDKEKKIFKDISLSISMPIKNIEDVLKGHI